MHTKVVSFFIFFQELSNKLKLFSGRREVERYFVKLGCTAQCTQLPPSFPTIPQQCTHKTKLREYTAVELLETREGAEYIVLYTLVKLFNKKLSNKKKFKSYDLSLANDFLQRTLMLHDIFYLRHERVTRKMTITVSNVSVCYTFFRERNNGRIRSWPDP